MRDKNQMEMAETYLKEGDAFRTEGEWEKALQSYKRAIELEPENWNAYHHLGDVLFNLEKFEQALDAYDSAIRINPSFIWSHTNKGRALEKLGDLAEANRTIQQALSVDPNFALGKYYLGEILEKSGDLDNAIEAYKNAIQLSPNILDASDKIGQLQIQKNNKNKFREVLSRDHKKEPLKIVISVLLFYAQDRTKRFIDVVPEKIIHAAQEIDAEVSFIFRNNSPEPDEEIQNKLEEIRNQFSAIDFQYIKSHNLGFGGGHNSNYQLASSDVFVVINNDIELPHFKFLLDVVARFTENPKLAAVGAIGTPTHIQSDFAYVPDKQDPLRVRDYAEASILFIKSEIFEKIGGFDEEYFYAYFEDSDLSLRLKQAGYEVEHIEMPFQHFRSSSAATIPEQTISTIYQYNRARFLSRWSNYLKTRKLQGKILINLSADGIGDLVDCFYPVKALVDQYVSNNVKVTILTRKASLNFLFGFLPVTLKNSRSVPINVEQDYDQVYDINNLNYSSPLHTLDMIAAKLGVYSFSTDETDLQKFLNFRSRPISTFDLPSEYISVHLDSQRSGFEGRAPVLKECVPALERLLQDAPIALVGMHFPKESQDSYFENFIANNPNIIDLRNSGSIEDTTVVIANSKMFFGVDSGPMHIAQLLNVPTFAIFGPIHPWTKLYRLENSGAVYNPERSSDSGSYHRMVEPAYYFCMRRDEACVKEIDSDMILGELEPFLNGYKFDWNKLTPELRYRQREWLTVQLHNPLFKSRILTGGTFSTKTLSDLIIQVCEVFENRSGDVINHFISQSKDELSEAQSKIVELQERLLQTEKELIQLKSVQGRDDVDNQK